MAWLSPKQYRLLLDQRSSHLGRRNPDLRTDLGGHPGAQGGWRPRHGDHQGGAPHADNILPLTAQLDAPLTTASPRRHERPHRTYRGESGRSGHRHRHGHERRDRDDDTVTLTLYSGSAGNATPEKTLSIDIEDKDVLPEVEMMVTDMAGKVDDPQPTSVTEGDTIYVVVNGGRQGRGRY